MGNIYEIADSLRNVEELLATAETDEEIGELLPMLAIRESELAAKAEAYAKVRINMRAEIDALKSEKKRIESKVKTMEANLERMEGILQNAMRYMGKTKLRTEIGTWSITQNPWSSEVTDASKVPSAYLIPQEPKIDRAKALADFKESGELIPGFDFRRTEGLRFK